MNERMNILKYTSFILYYISRYVFFFSNHGARRCEGEISDERLSVSHGHCSHLLFIFHRTQNLKTLRGRRMWSSSSFSYSQATKKIMALSIKAQSPNIPFKQSFWNVKLCQCPFRHLNQLRLNWGIEKLWNSQRKNSRQWTNRQKPAALATDLQARCTSLLLFSSGFLLHFVLAFKCATFLPPKTHFSSFQFKTIIPFPLFPPPLLFALSL